MSSIDNRVVQMKFDNAQFEQGIKTSLASLEALNKSLKLDGATKGLSDLNAAGKNVNLSGIAASVDGLADKFRALSVVAITALATIVHQAVTAGLTLSRSLTVDPIRAGLTEYETNLNSIQTILSNTAWQNTGLADVNKALATLNTYSDQTIYNFGQMARNIGTFTAAGVKLDVATNAIKGIANLAAVSGSNAEQASSAMYQLSQALATGTLKLIDWNSVVNAGMGGKVFQDALMETARVHGVAIDKMVKDAGGFRNTLENGWLTGEVLTETLSKFTGDLTAAQLKTMGYNAKQIEGILKMGKIAQDAATKVKTVSQLIGTLQEAAGSGWAATWQLIFGDFDEAKGLFTEVNTVLGGFISASANARNKVLGDWKALGGRTALIDTISNAFHALIAVITPIKEAFREMFPAATGKSLYDLTKVLQNFTKGLIIGSETADKLRRTFAGLFAILGIGWDIIKGVAGVLFALFQEVTGGTGSFLEITANIGDFLVELRAAINEGNGLAKVFQFLSRTLTAPIKFISEFVKTLAAMSDTLDTKGMAHGIVDMVKGFEPLDKLVNFVSSAWGHITSSFDNAWHIMEPLASKFTGFFHEISDAMGGLDFSSLLNAINTGAFVSLILILKKGLSKNGGISGVIGELTETLGAMQKTLQATTLLEIAIALGILAASVLVLSTIDSEALAVALSAIAIMFTQLLAALAVLQRIPSANVVKLYVMAGALSLLGIAVGILSISVKSLADLDTEELVKGLTGVTVLLAGIVAAANFLPDGARLISTGLGLLILSAAIKVLASAVTDLSGLSWEEMAKGLTGVGVLLGALALFSQFAGVNATGVLSGAGIILLAVGIKILASAMHDIATLSWEEIGKGMATLAVGLTLIAAALILIPPTSLLSAAAILVVAASLKLIGDALAQMGSFSWEQIGKGLTTLAGALLLIGTAITLIPPTAPLSAAGVLIVAVAIGILADALAKMGGMSWTEIIKGLVTLAGALAIITAALLLLPAALPGAAALLIVAGALTILAGVLKILGNMSWGEIIKGLVALAAVFIVLGVAGALLGPVVPVLLGLGAAIALIGVGLALAGAGVFLFAAGMAALSVSGALGAAAIVAIVSAVIGLIPTLIEQLGIALLLIIKIIADAVPQIVELLISIIVKLLEGFDKISPMLTVALLKLILMVLTILEEAIPRMVVAGYHILIGILSGIRDNIAKVIAVAAQIIEQFLRGIGNALPGIIQAGVDLILKFIRGLTKAIDDNAETLGKAGGDLAVAIIRGMVKGLLGGTGQIVEAAKGVARSALNAAKALLGISSPSKEFATIGRYSSEGLALGLEKYSGVVENSAEKVGQAAMNSLRTSLSDMASLVDGDMNLTPTITPVLDLTNVKKNSSMLDNLLSTKPIVVSATYSSAKQASAAIANNNQTPPDNAVAGGSTLTYNQYNTSPKALTSAEIYRQTKNQLSTVKGGLPE